jgi:RNase adaptor protein for sRNA GlmZ degradation
MPPTAQPDVLVITRGHRHQLPAGTPAADFELDLRRTLADPAHRPEGDMLDLTGLDPVVRAFVLDTRGARRLVKQTVRLVRGAAAVKPVVVWVGCAGGKHRAAAIGEEVMKRLRRRGLRFWARPLEVEVRHLHVHLPRVIHADERIAC